MSPVSTVDRMLFELMVVESCITLESSQVSQPVRWSADPQSLFKFNDG